MNVILVQKNLVIIITFNQFLENAKNKRYKINFENTLEKDLLNRDETETMDNIDNLYSDMDYKDKYTDYQQNFDDDQSY